MQIYIYIYIYTHKYWNHTVFVLFLFMVTLYHKQLSMSLSNFHKHDVRDNVIIHSPWGRKESDTTERLS